MKILPFDPKSACGTKNLDESRLGFHAKAILLSELKSLKHGIVIFGLADDTGIHAVGGRPGAKSGPEAARQKLYKFTVGKPRVPLYDLGDLQPESTIERTHERAEEAIRAIHAAGLFPIIIGGGHDLAYPEAHALLTARGKKSSFLNVDAHLDLRPTTHGITSGSPWYLLRESALFQKLKCRIEEFGIQPHCNAHTLQDYARKHKIGITWLSDIHKKKISAPAQFTKLLKSAAKTGEVQVSLDIDSVVAADAPGCSAPQTLGFSARDAIEMCAAAAKEKQVKSFGIYELSPALDQDGKTAALVAHCLSAFIENRIKA